MTNIERIDLGVAEGFRIWEVRNADTGEVIGSDMQAVEVDGVPTAAADTD